MEEVSSKNYMINYGLATSVVLVSFSLMLFFLEAHYEQDTTQTIVNTLIIFAGITFGCIAFKNANNNKIKASTVRKIGTGISLVIALVSVFYFLFLTNIMEPDYMDKVLEISYNQTMADYPEALQGMDLNNFIENSKPFTFLTYPIILISTLLFGFLYSVFLSLFIKTKKQL
ncbi:DUF4199 domain-containing protein [Flavobacteriaceae bacterium]|nr:DUF4199 domain-containing protein [Flavobacteriaceae bacterium]MDB4050454.1 DUF4199 domain-containing protein [Flavobacteriaceae bacterium]MDB4239548.1 DUF4199 domain-containing protein [Flavobacteriaceae bacterium]